MSLTRFPSGHNPAPEALNRPPYARAGQSRWWSFCESWANVAVGFSVNFVANLVVLPQFGFAIKPSQALGMGAIFTVISVVRSYALRRLFNARDRRRARP